MAGSASFEILRSDFNVILNEAFHKNNVEILQEHFSEKKHTDAKSVLDQVFRDLLLKLIPCSDVEILQNYVTFCIQTCRLGMTTSTMPVVLLGDIFDALTLDKCEQMFAFVENGVHIWKEDQFFSACKNNLLRMCNDLLRRLSRSQNTVFCGRILLFLAKFFPFSERSGLNIVSEFNLDNFTEFGADINSQSLKESLEAESNAKKENEKVKIDYNLYCKFWALQDFFRNPNQCYNKVQWKVFASHASNVLMAFSSYKLDEVQRKQIKLDTNVLMHSLSDEPESHYFAKYLTNQKLLELQLSDSNFRRFVLVQFLILFQYLNSSVKFKSEGYELKPDQKDWVTNTMTDMVYGLLAETPPDGRAFARSVKHILAREEHWNTWKNDGCPEFKRPLHTTENEDNIEKRRNSKPKRPKRLLGDLIKEANTTNKYIMGNSELTKLWNLCPDNLEACKGKDRDFLPSLDSYFAEALEESDPAFMIEEKYKKVNDGNFGWRALRLLARRSPHFFTHNNNPINKLPEYLDIMIQKIARDKPDRNNQELENDTQNDPEMEVELLKDGETDDQTEENTPKAPDEVQSEQTNNGRQPNTFLTEIQLDSVSIKIDKQWRKLAAKCGYQSDEIEFFANQQDSDPLRCRHMLVVWFSNDDDASIENLIYILEGLGIKDAADCLKEHV